VRTDDVRLDVIPFFRAGCLASATAAIPLPLRFRPTGSCGNDRCRSTSSDALSVQTAWRDRRDRSFGTISKKSTHAGPASGDAAGRNGAPPVIVLNRPAGRHRSTRSPPLERNGSIRFSSVPTASCRIRSSRTYLRTESQPAIVRTC